MSESNIPLEDPIRHPATDGGPDGTLTQPTPDYQADKAAELEMAISMSLEQAIAEEVGGTLIQSTPDREGEDVELKRAIEMSLEQSNAETTEDSSVNYTPIDMEEQAELDQALFLSNLPSELSDKQVAQLYLTRAATDVVCAHCGYSQVKAWELDKTAGKLVQHFQQSADCAEIDMAVEFMEEAIKLTPDGHEDKAVWFSNLGTTLSDRFRRFGELGDLEHTIWVRQQAVDRTPDGHAAKADRLSSLGGALSIRFEYLGELGDIAHAIQFMQQAIDITPDGHADKAGWLNALGGALCCRFEHLGELRDLEHAIQVMQQVMDLTPHCYADKAAWLSNLGGALLHRFERLGEQRDLEHGIWVMQQAVNLSPDSHVNKPIQLNNLGGGLRCRFECLGKLEDIEHAIQVRQKAVDLTPDGHALRANWLAGLGGALLDRFGHLRELGDLEHAIQVKQEAVDLTPDGHASKAALLNSLGVALMRRFENLRELGDIEHAIWVMEQAMDLTPDSHAAKAERLTALGGALLHLVLCFEDPGDIKNAISTYQQATTNTSSKPSVRYKAACAWAVLSSTYQDSSAALDACKVVLEIIPQLVWLGQTVYRRYEELPKIGTMINTAVATAISVGNLTQAVEWLEEGRGIVWGQILQLRSPLDDLHDQYPALAKDLERVSQALQNAGTSTRSNIIINPNMQGAMTGRQEAQQHTQWAAEYEELIATVRKLDGFDSFLKPKKLSALTPTAANGPIIIINVDQSRCDAIILSSSHGIIHFPLPDFSLQQAEELRLKLFSSLEATGVRVDRSGGRKSIRRTVGGQRGDHFKSVLADLWSKVVQPVLSGIQDMLHDYAEGYLPHITWCATGALAFLPLHAAGIYGSKDPSDDIKLSDFAVSSYTTTLSTMLNSGSKIRQDPREKPKVLIVSQPATLPGTKEEARIIQAYTSPEHSCHLTHDKAVVDTVKSEMNKHEIVHLACHGIQDSENPLNSAFILYDGQLRLQDLMRLSLENAELAFLSACQTAAGDETLPEEAVHLAAGMLAVGYPSVIATMWSIRDKDAPIVADKVYESILGRNDELVTRKTSQSAAYALHAAVEHLRKEVGEMEFVKWVPFVHYGV